MGVKAVFDASVAPGEVVVAWMNAYSSIVIRTGATTLIFDPVQIALENCLLADAILITHEHMDHFDPGLVKQIQESGIPVFATPFIEQLLPRPATVLKAGNSVSVGDFKLFAERCDHPANEPLSFVISANGGSTIYHPSDSQAFPEMVELGEKYRPEVLLYSGTSTEKAAQIAKLVKPGLILSYYNERNWAKQFLQVLRDQVPQAQARLIKRLEIWRC